MQKLPPQGAGNDNIYSTSLKYVVDCVRICGLTHLRKKRLEHGEGEALPSAILLAKRVSECQAQI